MAEIILANLSDISGFASTTVAVAGTSYAAASQGIYLLSPTAAFAFTLPGASQVEAGAFVIVKDAGGAANVDNITISPASGTIEGAASLVLNRPYDEAWFSWSGSVWNVFGRYAPVPTIQVFGQATLVAGQVIVPRVGISASALVFLSRASVAGTPGNLTVTITAGASFTISSSDGLDTSTVNYLVMEAA